MNAVARRLADLGVRSGITVECLRRAPLGDPSVFELCGYLLCLRKSESARVRVVRIEGEGESESESESESEQTDAGPQRAATP